MRVTCPVPWRSREAARSSEKASSSTRLVDQTQPSWASFSSRVMRPTRSLARSRGERAASRQGSGSTDLGSPPLRAP